MTTVFEGAPKFGGISGDHARVTAIEDRVLIRVALEMAATEAEECSTCADCGDCFTASDAIRDINPADVLAKVPPAPDAVARLVETAIAEYLLEPPFQTELERMGRKATARGMMVRLGIYEKFKEALAAMEASHDH